MWKIEGRTLQSTEASSLDKEELLQDWLREDIGIIDADLLVIGEEVTTDLGDRLDLLALDPAGQLVVIELKRDRTPRDVVAQVLGYTAWAADLTYDEIDDIARDHLDRELADAFEEAFGEELPETINDDQRMIVVAASLDAHVERSLRYLSEKWGVDINAVFFRCFKGPDGDEYLVRSWLEEPSEVERRKKSGRSTGSTIDELREMAAERGAGEEFDMLLEYAVDRWGLIPWRYNRKLSFHGHYRGERPQKVFGIYPRRGDEPGILWVEISIGRILDFFGISEDELRQILPEKTKDWGGSKLYAMSCEDMKRFAEVVSGGDEAGVAENKREEA
jgi:hypothetical protein